LSGRETDRRGFLRSLGKPLGDAVRGTPRPAPADEVPVEEGSLVVDLALHPVPPGTGRRFRGPGAPGAILLARVTADHAAAVTGDCPHCGGPLAFDGARDAVLCPGGAVAFRLDGNPLGEGRGLALRCHACRSAGARIEIDLVPL
jgi:nitrite reductase/ring-hydroxylating ferredoxin subunit